MPICHSCHRPVNTRVRFVGVPARTIHGRKGMLFYHPHCYGGNLSNARRSRYQPNLTRDEPSNWVVRRTPWGEEVKSLSPARRLKLKLKGQLPWRENPRGKNIRCSECSRKIGEHSKAYPVKGGRWYICKNCYLREKRERILGVYSMPLQNPATKLVPRYHCPYCGKENTFYPIFRGRRKIYFCSKEAGGCGERMPSNIQKIWASYEKEHGLVHTPVPVLTALGRSNPYKPLHVICHACNTKFIASERTSTCPNCGALVSIGNLRKLMTQKNPGRLDPFVKDQRVYEHEMKRIRTMSTRALYTRIGKMTKPEKLRMFIALTQGLGKPELARAASRRLRELGYRHNPRTWYKQNPFAESLVASIAAGMAGAATFVGATHVLKGVQKNPSGAEWIHLTIGEKKAKGIMASRANDKQESEDEIHWYHNGVLVGVYFKHSRELRYATAIRNPTVVKSRMFRSKSKMQSVVDGLRRKGIVFVGPKRDKKLWRITYPYPYSTYEGLLKSNPLTKQEINELKSQSDYYIEAAKMLPLHLPRRHFLRGKGTAIREVTQAYDGQRNLMSEMGRWAGHKSNPIERVDYHCQQCGQDWGEYNGWESSCPTCNQKDVEPVSLRGTHPLPTVNTIIRNPCRAGHRANPAGKDFFPKTVRDVKKVRTDKLAAWYGWWLHQADSYSRDPNATAMFRAIEKEIERRGKKLRYRRETNNWYLSPAAEQNPCPRCGYHKAFVRDGKRFCEDCGVPWGKKDYAIYKALEDEKLRQRYKFKSNPRMRRRSVGLMKQQKRNPGRGGRRVKGLQQIRASELISGLSPGFLYVVKEVGRKMKPGYYGDIQLWPMDMGMEVRDKKTHKVRYFIPYNLLERIEDVLDNFETHYSYQHPKKVSERALLHPFYPELEPPGLVEYEPIKAYTEPVDRRLKFNKTYVFWIAKKLGMTAEVSKGRFKKAHPEYANATQDDFKFNTELIEAYRQWYAQVVVSRFETLPLNQQQELERQFNYLLHMRRYHPEKKIKNVLIEKTDTYAIGYSKIPGGVFRGWIGTADGIRYGPHYKFLEQVYEWIERQGYPIPTSVERLRRVYSPTAPVLLQQPDIQKAERTSEEPPSEYGIEKNPSAQPSQKDVETAAKKAAEFHDMPPKGMKRIKVPNLRDGVLVKLGIWPSTTYFSGKWNKKNQRFAGKEGQLYIHEWGDKDHHKSKRMVVFKPDKKNSGKGWIVAWGRGRLTPHGIEDLKSN